MIRRAANTGGDSDDERVTYDDEIVGGSQHDVKVHHEPKVPASKHRNLFQYRKFKGDLDNDFDNEDTVLNWKDPRELLQKGLDFDLNSFQSKPSSKPTSKNLKAAEAKVATSKSVVPTIQPKDVASDRPDHWKSTSVPRAKSVTETRKNSALPDPKRQKARSGIAIPAPLKAAAPAPASRALSFSFQPSWMQSNTSSSSSSNRRSLATSIIEDISEDISDIYSNQPPMDDGGWNQHDDHFTAPVGSHELSAAATAPATGGALVTTPQRTPGMGVGFSQLHSSGGGGGGSGVGIGSSGGGSRKYSSKARPGTIKAKYQKVMRDVDAGENRMLSIPATQLAVARSHSVPHAGVVVDLQDPRSRARLLVDVEVVQLLPERSTAPFRGVKGVVLFTHRVVRRSSLVSSATSPSGAGAASTYSRSAGIAAEGEEESGMTVAATVGEGEGVSDAIAVEGNRVSPEDMIEHNAASAVVDKVVVDDGSSVLAEGVRCTLYFKPSTCYGNGRALREGLNVRIYDPEVLRGVADKELDDIVLICTQCWEPVSGYTAINSL